MAKPQPKLELLKESAAEMAQEGEAKGIPEVVTPCKSVELTAEFIVVGYPRAREGGRGRWRSVALHSSNCRRQTKSKSFSA